MRILLEIFGQTVRTLWAHKLRSFLTMFGIAWGVGSLLLLVGLGEGFRSGNRKQFDEIGENVMFIWGGRAPAMNGSFTSLRWYFLTYRDFEDVARECPDVKLAAPVISRNDVRAVSDYFQSSGQLMGVPAYFNDIRYLPVAEGRWLNDFDVSQKRTVEVIGKIFDAMNTFLGSVGLVTLGLGAIGIINIMLVSVADRTREIGLRKALGATCRSILFQFFAEGAFLTVMSGGIGMACAAGFMALLGLLPQPQGCDTPRLVPSTSALAIAS